jgi:predicted PurR-regulated permease PerM
VLVPVAFALFLAILCQPLFGGLVRRRVPAGIAVLATVLVLGTVIALFLVLLLGSLSELQTVGPHYMDELRQRIAYTVEWWQAKGVVLADWMPADWRSSGALVGLARGTLTSAVRLLSEGTIVLLTLVFLLAEAAALPRRLARLPTPVRETFAHFAHVSAELQRYLAIKTLMSATIGLAVGLWVAFLGVDFAVLCGLLAFAFHFVPNVGAVLAAGPAMVLAFVQFDASKAVAVGAGYLLIGLALGNLAEPALLGRRLDLSPLVVFLSLVFWGWLWGPVGMFLSVPMTMAIKIVLAHSRDWGWVARLIDGAAAAPGEAEPRPPAAEPDGPRVAAGARTP